VQIASLQLSVRLALLLTAVCAVFLTIGDAAEADAPFSQPVEHVVVDGETLWSIASSHTPPGEDVRRYVQDISELSQVDGGPIFPGQVLLVPSA
jgi:hypothetical protein